MHYDLNNKFISDIVNGIINLSKKKFDKREVVMGLVMQRKMGKLPKKNLDNEKKEIRKPPVRQL